MMNYILCGLAIYGFIGLFIYVVGYISGEVQKAAHEECDEEVSENTIVIAMALLTVTIWPYLISLGMKKLGGKE